MFHSVQIRNLFLAPFIIWAGIFIFVPLIFIIWYGVTDAAGNFSLENLAMIFQTEFFKSLEMSVLLAFVSTAICLILAYPLCLILVERAKSAGLIITLLFVLPLWMNTLLSTMAWQTKERNFKPIFAAAVVAGLYADKHAGGGCFGNDL